jgi:hypothetical protein
MKPASVIRFLFTLVGVLLVNGCVTGKLWQEKSFNEPAPDPKLCLFHAGQRNDVLVQYDELNERRGEVRRRAYFLYEYGQQSDSRKKPRFVGPAGTNQASPITIVVPPVPPALAQSTNLYAVVATNHGAFALCAQGRELSSHDLPVYPDGHHRASQILLTPLAVTADVVLVASVVGLIWWAANPGQL